MKNFLLFLFAALIAGSFIAYSQKPDMPKILSNPEYRLDSSRSYWVNKYSDTIINDLNNSVYYYYSKDNSLKDKPVEILTVDIFDNKISYDKMCHYYDTNKNMIADSFFVSTDSLNWEYTFCLQYHYNNKGLKDYDAYYDADYSDVYLESENEYYYDANDSISLIKFSGWYRIDSTEYFNMEKYEFEYDSNNNRSNVYSYYKLDSNWVLSSKTNYYYNNIDKYTRILDYSRTGNNIFSKFMEAYYYYGDNNILIENISSYYDNDTVNSNDIIKEKYYYDENNNLDTLYQYYTLGNSKYDVFYVYFYSKIPTAVPENINNTDNNLSIYPNPASDKLDISYISEENSFSDISIKNIFGNNVVNLLNLPLDRGNNKFNIDISSLASGIYFCNMKFNSHSVMNKFIVVK